MKLKNKNKHRISNSVGEIKAQEFFSSNSEGLRFNWGLVDDAFTEKDFFDIQSLIEDVYNYDNQPIEEEQKIEFDNVSKYDELLKNSKTTKINSNIHCFNQLSRTSNDDIVSVLGQVREDEEDNDFGMCVLAQGGSLGGNETEVVTTFKGYLEIVSPMSILRASEFDGNVKSCSVYISIDEVLKRRLKNGDEVRCTYTVNKDGKCVIQSILAINEKPQFEWSLFRNNFLELKTNKDLQALNFEGEYLEPVAKQFKIYKGDNIFVYIDQKAILSDSVNKLLSETSQMFDKVIYINPNFNKTIDRFNNVINFTTKFNETFNNQKRIALLAINYAKRLAESGKNVGVVIDDINAVALLDKDYNGDMPISKTILSCAKNTECGAITMFNIVPLRAQKVGGFQAQDLFRYLETLGIIIDNDGVDLYNCYRNR